MYKVTGGRFLILWTADHVSSTWLGLCGGLALMVFGWVACVLGLLRVRRSMETQKAQEEMLDQVRMNFSIFLDEKKTMYFVWPALTWTKLPYNWNVVFQRFSNCGTVSFCPVRNSKMSLFSNRDHKFCSGVVNCSKLKRCLPKSWLAMCINGLRSVSLIKNISPSLLISLFWLKMLASRWALIKFWFSTIKFCAWRNSCCFLINSAELSSWKGKLSVKLFSKFPRWEIVFMKDPDLLPSLSKFDNLPF